MNTTTTFTGINDLKLDSDSTLQVQHTMHTMDAKANRESYVHFQYFNEKKKVLGQDQKV